jgi:hypothetical protein
MNSKSVLQKILTLLSSSDEAVKFTEAQTKDGTILDSPTFDLGETIETVAEDGTKSPAADGEYEVALKDSEGKEVIIRVQVKDGKIESRENVEEANPEVPVEAGEEVVDKKAAIEEELADATTEVAKALPNTTDEDPRNTVGEDSEETENDPIITLGYRIDELESKLAELTTKFESAAPQEGEEVSSLEPIAEELESDLPKLDGAPVETKFSSEQNKSNFGKKSGGYQSSVLSKMYK